MKHRYFSIIIPVYNCEKFLDKMLKSIIEQTFKDFELLLIDDGSSDKSGKICDKYSNKYSNVITFHIANSGVSNARNVGIKNAAGKYICFFDSDDYVDIQFLEFAKDIFENNDVQLINTGFYSEVETLKKVDYDIICSDEKLYKNKEEIKEDLIMLWDKHMLYNVWNKVYRLDIIRENNIFFPKYNFGEDMDFNIEYLKYVNRFYNSSTPYYHYIKERMNSITTKYNDRLFEIRIKEYYKFNSYLKEQGLEGEKSREFSSRRFLERAIGCIENICGSDLRLSVKRDKVKLICTNKLVIETIKIAKFKSIKMKILVTLVESKNITLIYLFFRSVSIIRKRFPNIFNKLKNSR